MLSRLLGQQDAKISMHFSRVSSRRGSEEARRLPRGWLLYNQSVGKSALETIMRPKKKD